MMLALTLLTLVVCLTLLIMLASLQPLFTGLTVRYSWRWSLVAASALILSVVMSGHLFETSPAISSLMHLVSVVLLLTPAVSTLGARSPGAVPWQFFVVMPLIIVLLWPGLSDLVGSRGQEPLRLGVPAFSGICLVLMMSMSTCLGTSLTIASLFFLAAVCLGLCPAMGWMKADSPWKLLIPVLLLCGNWLGARSIRRRLHAVETAMTKSELVDSSWRLVQDLYGLVWARRIQDRVNQFAAREQWTVLLTHDGFRDMNGNCPSDQDLEKPRDALRWVLTRFADDHWISEKLFRLG